MRTNTRGLAVAAVTGALYAVLTFLTHWKPLKKLHPIVFIAIGAVAGILLKM